MDGSIRIGTKIDQTGATEGLRGLKGELEKFGRTPMNTQGIDKSIDNVSRKLISLKKVVIGLGLGVLIKSSVKEALDYIAGDQVYLQTMGKWKNATKDFTEDLKNKMGISRSEMRRYISVMYNMITAIGIADNNAYKMSKSMSMLAQDLGAFHNLTTDEALAKLQAGLTGNVIAMKELGVVINDAQVKQIAYSNGIAQQGEELSETQKVMARYIGIMQQTSNAQGFLAATINSPNAQLRMLSDSVKTLKYTFGQLFIPILQATLPYLNALAKLATIAAESIARLFGIKVGDELTEDMVTVSNNATDFSNSTNEAVNNLEKANTKAKKLKKTLAGFDEKNVLNDNVKASGTGGGTTGNTTTPNTDMSDFKVPEYNFSVLDGISSKVDKIVEDILKFLEPLSKISFLPLELAFANLMNAIKPLKELATNVLLWFYDKVLIPLSQFTIEKLIPSFINLLAEAIRMFIPVLKNFMGVGMWLFDNFLTPLAKWTGDLIINTLDTLAGAFKKVGNSKDAVMGLTTVLGALIAIKVGGFLLNLTSAFGAYSSALAAGVDKSVLLNGLTQNYGKTVGGLTTKLSPLIDIYNKYNNKLLEGTGLTSALRAPSALLGGVFEGLGKTTQNLGLIMQRGVKGFIDMLSAEKKYEEQGGKTRTITEKMGDALKTFYNTHLKSGVDKTIAFTSNIKTQFNDAGGGVTGAMSVMKTGVVSGFDSMKHSVGQALVNIGGGIRNIGAAIAANPLGVLLTMFGLLMQGSESFRTAIQDLMTTALEPIGQVLGTVLLAFKPIVELLSGVLVKILSALSPLLELIGKALSLLLKPLEFIGNIIGKVVDGVKSFFGIKTNDNTSKELDSAKQSAEDFKTSNDRSIESLKNSLSALEKAGQGTGKLADEHRKAIAEYGKIGGAVENAIIAYGEDGEATDALKKKHEKYNKAVDDRIDLVKEIEDAEKTFASSQLDLMDAEDLVTEKKKNLNEVIKKHGENSREAKRATLELEEAQIKLKDTQGVVKEQTQLLNDKNTLLKESNKEVNDTFGNLNGTLEETGNGLEIVDTNYSDLAANTGTTNKDLTNGVSETTKSIYKNWFDTNKNINTSTKNTSDKTKTNMDNAKKSYNTAIDSMGRKSDNFTVDTKTNLATQNKNWKNLTKDMPEYFGNASKKIDTSSSNTAKNWGTSTDKMSKDTKTGFGNILKESETLKNSMKDITEGVAKTAAAEFKKVTNSGKNSMTNIISTWTDKKNGIEVKLKKVFDNVASDLKSAFTGIKTKFNDVANKIVGPIGKAINAAIRGLNHLAKKMGSSKKMSEWNIPQYKRGSDGLRKDTVGIVNDQKGGTYRELIVEPDGTAFIPKGRDVILPMKKGTKIMPADQTKEYIKGLPRFQKGIGTFVNDWTNSTKLPKEKVDIAKQAKKSVQTTLNNYVNLSKVKDPFDDMIGKALGSTLFGDMVKWFKKSFPLSNYLLSSGNVVADISGFLKTFVEKYINKWVNVTGGIGTVGNGGAPDFSGQCASLATSWLSQAFGYWFSANGNQFGGAGKAISKSIAKAGDIIYWGGAPYGHVAVYTGGNSMFEQNAPIGSKAHLSALRGGNFVRPRGAMKDVPKLAQGGIVVQPTQAIIGEAGREAVLPLHNNTEWMDDLAEKVSKLVGGDSKQPINIYLPNGKLLARYVIDLLKKDDFVNNGGIL